ncbi:MAG: 3-phosphoshikimate 1-carboxyvinyltransferase [Sediminispirochaetaceae bacterium]
MHRTIYPSKIAGTLEIPGSKSHTIRGLLIAALAEGTSRLELPLESSDTVSCRAAVTALGAKVKAEENFWDIEGTGGNLQQPEGPIDVGNSGTTLYLAAGAAATAHVPVRFTGDEQIQRRSAANLLTALRDLSGEVTCEQREGYAPFTVRGPLKGGETSIECPTSQYLSSLLLASPLSSQARKETLIRVPLLYERPYVDMTLDWLDRQGIVYRRRGYEEFTIPTGQRYKNFTARIPGDFSSATFFAAAAAVTGSRLRLLGLDVRDSQGDKQAFEILRQMGCSVEQVVGGIDITGPHDGRLKGGEFDLNSIPDALPALAVAGCFSSQRVSLLNVPQARQKETDRIAVMREELHKLGARVEEREDGIVIHGGGFKSLRGGEVCGHQDHRVIMALSIAGLAAEGPVGIDETEAAAVTFPGFFDLLEEIGAKIEALQVDNSIKDNSKGESHGTRI